MLTVLAEIILTIIEESIHEHYNHYYHIINLWMNRSPNINNGILKKGNWTKKKKLKQLKANEDVTLNEVVCVVVHNLDGASGWRRTWKHQRQLISPCNNTQYKLIVL